MKFIIPSSVWSPAHLPARIFPQLAEYLNQRQAEFDKLMPHEGLSSNHWPKHWPKTRATRAPLMSRSCAPTTAAEATCLNLMKAVAESLRLPLTTWSGGTESTAMNPWPWPHFGGRDSKLRRPPRTTTRSTTCPWARTQPRPASPSRGPARPIRPGFLCRDGVQRRRPKVPHGPGATTLRTLCGSEGLRWHGRGGNLRRKMQRGNSLGGPQDQRAFDR